MMARVFPVLLALVLVASFSAGSAAEESPDKDAPDSPGDARAVEAFFDELIARQLRDEHVAGATVAMVKDGELAFARGYGYADLENREPVVADETLFYPGSAGKLFTWTAVMQLVPVWFVLALLGFAQTYAWPTETVATITRLWPLSVPLTLGVVVLAGLAWKERYWEVAGRVHYTLVAAAAVVFVVLSNYWNLISP